jgi:hypothetical protein
MSRSGTGNFGRSPRCLSAAASNSPRTMKITVTLSPKHAKFITKYAALTGYTKEEFTSLFLADYFKQFDNFGDESFLRESIGAMKFKDRGSAERVQAWLIEWVSNRATISTASRPVSVVTKTGPSMYA